MFGSGTASVNLKATLRLTIVEGGSAAAAVLNDQAYQNHEAKVIVELESPEARRRFAVARDPQLVGEAPGAGQQRQIVRCAQLQSAAGQEQRRQQHQLHAPDDRKVHIAKSNGA